MTILPSLEIENIIKYGFILAIKAVDDQLKILLNSVILSLEGDKVDTNDRTVSCMSPKTFQFRE